MYIKNNLTQKKSQTLVSEKPRNLEAYSHYDALSTRILSQSTEKVGLISQREEER